MPRRNLRRAQSDSDEDDSNEHSLSALINDIKDVQRNRKRPAGLNITEIVSTSSGGPSGESSQKTDPLNLKVGGFIDMKKMKHADIKDADIEEGIKQTFSKESHLRDEDEEMRKYVEEELSRRKGGQHKGDKSDNAEGRSTPDLTQDILFQLPDHLKRYQSKKTEEMLSNQMLCGIPEVDLGVDAKIRNIEETEAAKLRLLKEAIEKKRDLAEKLIARQNLAKNLAKSYVQHNIYKIDETTLIGSDSIRAKPKRPNTQPVPVVDEDTPKWVKDGRTVERPKDAQKKNDQQQQEAPKRPGTSQPNRTKSKFSDFDGDKFVKRKS